MNLEKESFSKLPTLSLLIYYGPITFCLILALIRVSVFCQFATSCPAGRVEKTSNFWAEKTATPKPKNLLEKFRKSAVITIQTYFPSPHSELLAGMVLGIDELKMVPSFKKALVDTGTIHVVVVSGFNISLVGGMLLRMLGPVYSRRNLVICQSMTLLYAVVTGFEAPVVRAWIMSSIFLYHKYSGSRVDGFRVLMFCACLMILITPKYFFEASFQLSFSATLGLILFGNFFTNLVEKILGKDTPMVDDISATFAAQVFVWPIILNMTGKFSLLGLIVNPLILWTVPIATILGSAFLLVAMPLGFVADVFGRVVGYGFLFVTYPFLDIFQRVVYWFSKIEGFGVSTQMSNEIRIFLVVYLLLIFCAGLRTEILKIFTSSRPKGDELA